ncbi:hypothetical protein [Mycobacterium sp. OTB74]|jgi:hypothetical protein|uniref:hypothetical protein n=1 Tax=Mycobacterium sp. OTB74 TaxID=1853452 RepID=UPI002475E8D1|nr:hypothetical protein [Mycobacterium sp. OTB74]MDH6243827.1 hypothetical protein [Mycobacterium sp. OTB74]
MGIERLQLSLMAFPQSWTPAATPTGDATLAVNVLVLPVGDPRAPLGGGAAFAGTAIHVVVNICDKSAGLPTTVSTPLVGRPLVLTPPPVATTLFDQLFKQSVAKGMTPTTDPPSATTARIKKSLPASYTNAVAVEQPGPNTEVGDGYGCALRAQAPPPNTPAIGPDISIAWGQILSLTLRQPVLAQALGLVYPLTIPVPAGTLATGGFVYVTLDTRNPANPWVAQLSADSDFMHSYAAQLPALTSTARPLFAATLLPVVIPPATPSADLDHAQREAATYDDGFAQVVHSNQPTTIDAATLGADGTPPASDAGIQLGWDDEQITAWLNGQLDLLNVRADPSTHPAANVAEAPLGVQGYRVDVRPAGGQQSWSSLCEVIGTVGFTQQAYGGNAATPIDGELWLAPAPVRPTAGTPGHPNNDGNANPSWLPLYFALWTGGSLVLADPVVHMLATAFSATPTSNPVSPPPTPPNPRADLSAVPPLRYGADYDFRVRLVDLTGGGPGPGAQPVHAGAVPMTTVEFRRWVPPKALVVATDDNPQPYPAVPPAQRPIHTLSVRRPRIGYPEALFAGVDPATFALANLATLIAQARANGDVLDIADPDVGSFTVIVEAKMPVHDGGVAGTAANEVDGTYRVIYAVTFDFGVDPDSEITLTLDYTNVDDIGSMGPPAAGVTTLPIPTARDVRIRLQPQFDGKTNYYATGAPMTGPYRDYGVRQQAATEDVLFAGSAATQFSALYFQPGANIAQLLAQQLNLSQNALTLSGTPGQRTVFGASGALRHAISADDGAITFANQTELLGHWIVAITLQLKRDWTWDGFAQPSALNPGGSLKAALPSVSFTRDGQPIGTITVPRAIPTSTLQDPTATVERSFTQLVFFDAIDPKPAPGSFPAELNPVYTVTANCEAIAEVLSLPVTLPITTAPVLTPRIVATGVAESSYTRAADYSSTGSRTRMLWIEFEQAIPDPDDTYFGRVLAYGPDALLAGELGPTGTAGQKMLAETREPPLPIDPEPVRTIFPGQTPDNSGSDAMTELIPAAGPAGTVFLLPLPPGVPPDDLQLFGFWTYEFRVGHRPLHESQTPPAQWSTAQGRFGRALRVSGIQHPPPELICSANRRETGIDVSAPYATTVLNGRRVFSAAAGDPRTEIWFMLYAQAMQADGTSYRNILLTHAHGTMPTLTPVIEETPRAAHPFPEDTINRRLIELGLPETSPLSVLAVELLPFDVFLEEVVVPVEGSGSGTPPPPAPTPDPLGADLGTRRILRTSPLTALPSVC